MSQTTTNNDKQEALVFRGINFNLYKVRIQAKLRRKGLWKIVNGEATKDNDDDDDDLDSKEDKAFDLLVHSLDDDNLAYVAHMVSSQEVWKLLLDPYSPRTYADVSHVIHELHAKTYVAGASMLKHVTEMRGLQQKLMLMGSRVEDGMLARILLTSVKDTFPTTVEIMRSREPSPTLQQIIDRLLSKASEAEHSAAAKRKSPDEDMVMYTNKTHDRNARKKPFKGKCHYCHKIGHAASECRFKKRDLAHGVKRDHMPTEDEEVNVLEKVEEGFALATCNDIDLSDVWIIDSACTVDVTGNKNLFSNLSRSGLVRLKLADNSVVESTQGGSLVIQLDNEHQLVRSTVRYSQGLTKNLMSLNLLFKDGFKIARWDEAGAIFIKDTTVLRFMPYKGLFVLRPHEVEVNNACVVRKTTPKLVQWHLRLAHLNFGAIKQAARDGVVDGLHLAKSDLA